MGVFLSSANAADPDGVFQYCVEKVNKNNSFDCTCIAEKYYPKKAELEQLYGVPIMDKEAVMMHLTSGCMDIENTGEREYKVCMTNSSFKRNREEFGGERYCRCYSDEWKSQLSNHIATTNEGVDSNSRRHLKIMARSICQKKL